MHDSRERERENRNARAKVFKAKPSFNICNIYKYIICTSTSLLVLLQFYSEIFKHCYIFTWF